MCTDCFDDDEQEKPTFAPDDLAQLARHIEADMSGTASCLGNLFR